MKDSQKYKGWGRAETFRGGFTSLDGNVGNIGKNSINAQTGLNSHLNFGTLAI